MTEQLDMLQSLDPHWRRLLVDVPRARRTDPEPSHVAARAVKGSGRLGKQQQLVLAAVEAHPGSTSKEIGYLLAEAQGHGADRTAWRHIAGRRLSELAPFYVRRASPRICKISGQPATTWYAVRHQRVAV